MKVIALSLILISSMAVSVQAHASVKSSKGAKSSASAKSAKPTKKAKPTNSVKYKDYGTSHAFNSANIKGKVQEGNMRRIVVENDKSLEDLLGIRKNFADREREEGDRN